MAFLLHMAIRICFQNVDLIMSRRDHKSVHFESFPRPHSVNRLCLRPGLRQTFNWWVCFYLCFCVISQRDIPFREESHIMSLLCLKSVHNSLSRLEWDPDSMPGPTGLDMVQFLPTWPFSSPMVLTPVCHPYPRGPSRCYRYAPGTASALRLALDCSDSSFPCHSFFFCHLGLQVRTSLTTRSKWAPTAPILPLSLYHITI